MPIVVKIPPVLPPKDSFDVALQNAGDVIDVVIEVFVTPNGTTTAEQRAFSLEGRPPAMEHPATLPGATPMTLEVSKWGDSAKGDVVVVKASGTSSNKGKIVPPTP